jgi:hypothetical protein
MRRLVTLVLALALALPVAAWAQAKPDFSGSWTMNPDKSDPPPQRGGGGGGGGGGRMGGGGGMGGGSITIKQTAADIVITMSGRGGERTMTYKLDGSESSNEMPMGRSGDMMTIKSKAHWDGSTLVIDTTRDTPNGPVTSTEKRTLSSDGKEMTVVTSIGDNSRKVVYTKG